MKPHLLCLCAALATLGGVANAGAAESGRTPVILVTDIGSDIDDAWALALLLRSPELDLKLVLTDPVDTLYRAKVAAKFLERAGRGDVPIALGDSHGPTEDGAKTVLPWLAGYDISKYPGRVYNDGVAALIDTVEKSPTPVTIIAIGPVYSLALALEKDPGIPAKCRFVGMFGSFDRGYGDGPPVPEFNVKAGVWGLRKVLAGPWRDILITPPTPAAWLTCPAKGTALSIRFAWVTILYLLGGNGVDGSDFFRMRMISSSNALRFGESGVVVG